MTQEEKKPNCTAWIIIAKSQPKVISSKLPIYWTKERAMQDQKLFGGTVKKVSLYY